MDEATGKNIQYMTTQIIMSKCNKKINAIQYENDNEMTIAKSWMK